MLASLHAHRAEREGRFRDCTGDTPEMMSPRGRWQPLTQTQIERFITEGWTLGQQPSDSIIRNYARVILVILHYGSKGVSGHPIIPRCGH